MPLGNKDPEAGRLARALAEETGETTTEAAMRRRRRRPADELDDIAARCAALPVLVSRSPNEILGFDDQGLPCSWSSTALP